MNAQSPREKRIATLRALSSMHGVMYINTKPVHFIGLGTAGCMALEYIYQKGVAAKYTAITEPGQPTMSPGIHLIPFIPPKLHNQIQDDESILTSDISQKLILPNEIKEQFSGNHKYILLAGLGNYTGTYMSEKLSSMLTSNKKTYFLICSLPFLLEGNERNAYASAAFVKLRLNKNFRYFDYQMLTPQHGYHTLKKSFASGIRQFYKISKQFY